MIDSLASETGLLESSLYTSGLWCQPNGQRHETAAGRERWLYKQIADLRSFASSMTEPESTKIFWSLYTPKRKRKNDRGFHQRSGNQGCQRESGCGDRYYFSQLRTKTGLKDRLRRCKWYWESIGGAASSKRSCGVFWRSQYLCW